jgi:micrococcal nuclease
MHRLGHLFAFGLIILLLCSPWMSAFAGEEWSGEVVKVVDGDTFDITHRGSPVRVRLHGADAPESRQAFGMDAKKYASSLALHKIVRVEAIDTDNHGRMVAEVTLPGGQSLTQELVRAGLARWYQKYAPNDRKLEELEVSARWLGVASGRKPIRWRLGIGGKEVLQT